MHIKSTHNHVLPFIVLLFLLISNFVYSGQKQELPRSYGPLILGMSIKAFKAITGADPLWCATCVKDELEATLHTNKEEARRLRGKHFISSGASLKYQPPNLQPKSIHCFFYKDRLYLIVMSYIRDEVEAVKARYEAILGKPTGVDVWDTGISQLRWETSSTMLRVAYMTKTSGIDWLEISYGDLKIMKQKPYREFE